MQGYEEKHSVKITRSRHDGGVVVVNLEGKLMIGSGDSAFRDVVVQEITFGTRCIILNFTEVPYVDHAGLGEVVRCYTIASRKGAKVMLAGITKRFKDLLEITKLSVVFQICETVEEALKEAK